MNKIFQLQTHSNLIITCSKFETRPKISVVKLETKITLHKNNYIQLNGISKLNLPESQKYSHTSGESGIHICWLTKKFDVNHYLLINFDKLQLIHQNSSRN